MIRWRLYDQNPVRDMLEQMLQAAAQPGPHHRGEPMPINVHQSDADVWIEAALPGVQPDDIDLSCNEGLLTIRAHSEIQERDYFHQEMHSIGYLRQVVLPVECRFDQAEASFEHGMLRVRIPKQRPRAAEKIHIQVNRSAGPTTIEAAKGVGYREVAAKPKAKSGAKAAAKTAVMTAAANKPASKKASGGAARDRKAAPGSGSSPAR
jgi:HSP20 family protein